MPKLDQYTYDAIVGYMDDEIREYVHNYMAPCICQQNLQLIERKIQMKVQFQREENTMNEELKKLAEKYNWKLEVYHGEYKGVLCGVQETNRGEEPLPLYRFPGGVSLA